MTIPHRIPKRQCGLERPTGRVGVIGLGVMRDVANAARVRVNLPELQILIAGDLPTRTALEQQVQDAGLVDVAFYGNVDNELKADRQAA